MQTIVNVNSGNGTSSPIPFSSSNVSAVKCDTGRALSGLTFPGWHAELCVLCVSASQLLLVQTDAITGPGGSLFTGQILQQSGTFTAASLDAVACLRRKVLIPTTRRPRQMPRPGSSHQRSGSLSVIWTNNDGGTMRHGHGFGNLQRRVERTRDHYPDWRKPPALLYMIAKNQAILLSTGGKVSFGTLTPQAEAASRSPPWTEINLGGNEQPVDSNVKANLIQINANGPVVLRNSVQSRIAGAGVGNRRAAPSRPVDLSTCLRRACRKI